jgi:hypothetical protein
MSAENPAGDIDSSGSLDFVMQAMELDDVSVSKEDGRFVATVRGPDRGVIDATPVIELANKFGHQVTEVYADVEHPALTVEVDR